MVPGVTVADTAGHQQRRGSCQLEIAKTPFVISLPVEIDGIHGLASGGSGLDPTDAVDYREGDEGLTIRKLPGLVKFSNITLKWGITDDLDLWEWRKKIMDGKISERKNGSIVLMDDEGNDKARWKFREAWPTKWTGPTFNATATRLLSTPLKLPTRD